MSAVQIPSKLRCFAMDGSRRSEKAVIYYYLLQDIRTIVNEISCSIPSKLQPCGWTRMRNNDGERITGDSGMS